MPLTCADWLAVLAPRLTGPLFDSESVGRLRRLARLLPGECLGILEARLAPGTAPVDLSVRIRTPDQARTLAARLPSSFGDFLCRWCEPEGPLAPVRSLWLELDLDREPQGDRLPPPVVCAKLPQDADRLWLTGTLLPALAGHPPSSRQRDVILACLDALPALGHLLYLFSLRARGSDAVRLEIFGLEPARILDYLRRAAPRTVPEVLRIAPLFDGVERLHLSFDVSEEVLPRIGIEGSFPRQPRREPRWADLLARLVERGLCSPEKREAVLAWPGYDSFWTAPERWPVAEIGALGFCVRSLSHLKVICQPGREPEAKVYLALGPLDRSGAAGAASSPASRSALST